MKDLIINALKEAGVETDGLDDAQLLDKYNQLNAGEDEGSQVMQANELQDLFGNALKPLSDKLDAIELRVNASNEAELESLVEQVASSDNFPGLEDKEEIKKLGVNTLKRMCANLKSCSGLPFFANNQQQDQLSGPADMPE